MVPRFHGFTVSRFSGFSRFSRFSRFHAFAHWRIRNRPAASESKWYPLNSFCLETSWFRMDFTGLRLVEQYTFLVQVEHYRKSTWYCQRLKIYKMFGQQLQRNYWRFHKRFTFRFMLQDLSFRSPMISLYQVYVEVETQDSSERVRSVCTNVRCVCAFCIDSNRRPTQKDMKWKRSVCVCFSSSLSVDGTVSCAEREWRGQSSGRRVCSAECLLQNV